MPILFMSSMEALPEEVLTSILEHVCLWYDDTVGDVQVRLSRVSRKWRRIILHTPSFWSVLHLSPSHSPDRLLQSLDIHLERSKQYPLDITLRCYWNASITGAIFERIIPHSRRWKRLSIQTPIDDIFSYLRNVPGPSLETVELHFFSWERIFGRPQPIFPMTNLSNLSTLFLRNVTLGDINTLPCLKKLDLRGIVSWPAHLRLCDALNGSRALEHLTLHVKLMDVLEPVPDDSRAEKRSPISLPALQSCNIITSEGLSSNILKLLKPLSCPNLKSVTVQDSECASESETLMCYVRSRGIIEASPRHAQVASSLYVRSSDPYLAWSSLPPTPALTVLELRAPQWPSRNQLEELFSNLTALETLKLRDFQTSDALHEIGAGPPISISALRTLDIEFCHTTNSEDHHISQFFRILSLPLLRNLHLRKLLASEWENLLCCSYYPSLRCLSLVDMRDFVKSTADPVLAFPLLTDLHLNNVRSNDFIRRLLQGARIPSPGWPELQTLTIQGDDLISNPLLHRVVSFRREMGLRMIKLVLDKPSMNEESRAWLARHCHVELTHPV